MEVRVSQETQLNEIGFYVLAGAPRTPADLLPEMSEAEELGSEPRSSRSGTTSRKRQRFPAQRQRPQDGWESPLPPPITTPVIR
jgi:hypothetical protein